MSRGIDIVFPVTKVMLISATTYLCITSKNVSENVAENVADTTHYLDKIIYILL